MNYIVLLWPHANARYRSEALKLARAEMSVMLGRVAQAEMTAVSLATQIQFVQNMFLGAITGAGAILGVVVGIVIEMYTR